MEGLEYPKAKVHVHFLPVGLVNCDMEDMYIVHIYMYFCNSGLCDKNTLNRGRRKDLAARKLQKLQNMDGKKVET